MLFVLFLIKMGDFRQLHATWCSGIMSSGMYCFSFIFTQQYWDSCRLCSLCIKNNHIKCLLLLIVLNSNYIGLIDYKFCRGPHPFSYSGFPSFLGCKLQHVTQKQKGSMGWKRHFCWFVEIRGLTKVELRFFTVIANGSILADLKKLSHDGPS